MSCRKDLHQQLADLEPELSGLPGKRYWRSLDELSGNEAFQRLVEREFPHGASQWPDSLSRRKFLTLMGASLALGGIGGCSVRPAPSVDVVPYVRAPEEMAPGKPLFFATTMAIGGDAVGLLAESHAGRPTKIEGNPQHPASLGATSPLHQASVLGLYDPDRAKVVRHLGQERTWEDAAAAIRGAMEEQRGEQGSGLRILTGSVVSPTLARQIEDLLKQLPRAKWISYEPIDRDAMYQATQWAFGERLAPQYDFQAAGVVVALDADFLTSGPGHLRYAADFMNRRRVRTGRDDAALAEMNRLYVVETAVTCTGAKADHRLALKGREIAGVTRALARQLGVALGEAAAPRETTLSAAIPANWIAAVAADLQEHRGRSVVIAGDRQLPAVHLLAHAMNDALGNIGKTVRYTAPNEFSAGDSLASLSELARDMEQGNVDFLLILDANPVLTAPAELDFVKQMQNVPLRMHLTLYENETALQCHWLLPEAHYLEAWSDALAFDGTASIAQPLIEPLYQGRSAHEVLSLIADLQETPGRELIRAHWREHWKQNPPADAADAWETALHDGFVAGTKAEPKNVTLQSNWQQHLVVDNDSTSERDTVSANGDDLELVFLPDPTLYDGRFANNGWLQELPKPITQLTWGNAAIVSPATAQRLGLAAGSYSHGGEHGGYYMPVVELALQHRTLNVPCWIMPGHADDTVTLYLGNGRALAGRVGGSADETVGANAYVLRTGSEPWFVGGVKLTRTGRNGLVACTQAHHSMENRHLVRSASLDEYHQQPAFAAEEQQAERSAMTGGIASPLTLYEPFDYSAPKHKWGMSIDLTTCLGCNACVVACQAENNIPVVGKDQVARGREMHWLRVDRYVEGPADAPTGFYFQPLPCMHCENAPCEYVCPVEATVHSPEGLNEMVYNRCVGTRFCSNNCPYKVRRFNFMAYADFQTVTLRMQYNPDVTVRSRGVMEKCTYCVQRIRQAEIGAQVEDRRLLDGDVLTACQAACPTRAISFGDMNDSTSEVQRWKESTLHYGLLEDLNTVPRTTYLAALRNPNPELEPTARHRT